MVVGVLGELACAPRSRGATTIAPATSVDPDRVHVEGHARTGAAGRARRSGCRSRAARAADHWLLQLLQQGDAWSSPGRSAGRWPGRAAGRCRRARTPRRCRRRPRRAPASRTSVDTASWLRVGCSPEVMKLQQPVLGGQVVDQAEQRRRRRCSRRASTRRAGRGSSSVATTSTTADADGLALVAQHAARATAWSPVVGARGGLAWSVTVRCLGHAAAPQLAGARSGRGARSRRSRRRCRGRCRRG